MVPRHAGRVQGSKSLPEQDNVYQSVSRSEPAHIREFTVVLARIAQALRGRAAQPAAIAEALTEQIQAAGKEDRSAEPAG